MTDADILAQIARRLLPQEFNSLVFSVGPTREKGRLRFWQEELLHRAEVIVSTVSDFLRLFGNASPISIPQEPWTRERFLREIEVFPFGGFPLDETPPEWMAEAWESERVRGEISYDMRRDVSKLGELRHPAEFLGYLRRALPVHRQVELFHFIMEECLLREGEFRPGFEQAFPECVHLLPAPLSDEQIKEQLGMSEAEWAEFNSPPAPQESHGTDDILY